MPAKGVLIPCVCQYPACGKTFYRHPCVAPEARFCSRQCCNRNACTVPIPRICQDGLCGKTFYVTTARGKVARFCSRLCYSRTRAVRLPFAERFWKKVLRGAPDECWLWQAATNGQGYGQLNIEKKRRVATHVAWFLTYGVWPTMFLCHTCDLPACCNPAHLWEGTAADNAADRVAKGRNGGFVKPENVRRGERNGWAKLRDTDYARICELYATGLWTYRTLAEHYHLSQSGICNIVKRHKHTDYAVTISASSVNG